MADFETLNTIKKKERNEDDFPRMFVELIGSVPWKQTFLLFIVGLLIFSDLFIDRVLSKFPTTLENGCFPNNKGTTMQLIFLCMMYIIIYMCTEGGIL